MSGDHQLGPYRLLAELGHGGMADVYLAAVQGPRGMGFTKLAVVKKLRPALGEDPEFVTMLMDEARITARLSHPNVVQLFEVGKHEDTYFLAMEFLEGQPLYRIEQRAQKLGVQVGLDLYAAMLSDLLAGLHHAHELRDYDGSPLNVVHRDVTPHNVFVTYDGVVKVVDFGIAKAMGRKSATTQQGVVKGKYPYMSPEQVRAKGIDRRSDVFAVGVLLHNACAKQKLWAGKSDGEIVEALVSGTYEPSPIARGFDVPSALDAICRKALAHRPQDRYETADDMRADLEAFLGERTVAVRRKLESTMKELFASERGKLKQVVEAARITDTTADAGALAAAAAKAMLEGVAFASDAPVPSSSRRPPKADAAGASASRRPGPTVSERPGRPAASQRPTKPASPNARRKESPKSALWTFFGAFVLFTGIALFVTRDRVRPVVMRKLAPGVVRGEMQRHAVAKSDVTPLWPVARSKTGAEEPEPTPTIIDARHGNGTTGIKEPSSEPAPSTTEPKPPESGVETAPAKKLDETMPW